MATHYPIVFEREDSGVYSAYIAGLPVYAQGATHAKAASAIMRTLSAYLEAHPQEQPRADVRVAKVSAPPRGRGRSKPSLVTAAALVGRRTSKREGGEFAREWSLGRAPAPGALRIVPMRSPPSGTDEWLPAVSCLWSTCSPIAPRHRPSVDANR